MGRDPALTAADAQRARIEGYYNHRRRHSTLGYLTPVESAVPDAVGTA
jgi:transposase InsO family protein